VNAIVSCIGTVTYSNGAILRVQTRPNGRLVRFLGSEIGTAVESGDHVPSGAHFGPPNEIGRVIGSGPRECRTGFDVRTPRTVTLSGDLDIYEAPAVRAVLDVLDGPGTVDMSAVRYLDSSVLNELARVARRVGAGEITLVVTSANVRKVLRIVEFERLFRIVESVADEWTTA